MILMQTQIERAISAAVNESLAPKVKKIAANLPSRKNNFGTGMSSCHHNLRNRPHGSNASLMKRDFRSASDIRGDADVSPDTDKRG